MKKKSPKAKQSFSPSKSPDQQSYEQFVDWLTEESSGDVSIQSLKTQTIESPSVDSIKRLGTIPLLAGSKHSARQTTGRVDYDSWAGAQPVALRDITQGHIRRIRLRAGNVTVEIVAERGAEEWEFVARAYRSGKTVHDSVLKVGRQKIMARAGGFFQWSSNSVPKAINLLSYQKNLLFEELAW